MECNGTDSSDYCCAKPLKRRTEDVQRNDPQLPPFAVWRARHLRSRDLLFAVIATVVVLNYVRVTAPVLCAYQHPHAEQLPALQQQQGQLVWSAVCGRPANTGTANLSQQESSTTVLRKHPLLVSAASAGSFPAAGASAVGLFRHMLQAAVGFFLLCLVSPDPFHIIMPPLRTSFLLLLLSPMPLPNLPAIWRWGTITHTSRTSQRSSPVHSSTHAWGWKTKTCRQPPTTDDSSSSGSVLDHPSRTPASHADSGAGSSSTPLIVWYSPTFYWQYPQLRYCVIILQRILPLVAAALGVGSARNPYFEFTLGVFCWRMLRKYVYDGWMQYMLVLPLPLHMVISVCEFLLVYTTTLRVDAIYSSHAHASWYKVFHFAASVLFMLVLPTLGVARLERLQRQMYQQLQPPQRQQAAPEAAAHGDSNNIGQIQNANNASNSSSSSRSAKQAVLPGNPLLANAGSRESMAQPASADCSTDDCTAGPGGAHMTGGGVSSGRSVAADKCGKSTEDSTGRNADCAAPAGACRDSSSSNTAAAQAAAAGPDSSLGKIRADSTTTIKHQTRKKDKRRKLSAELFLDHLESSACHATAPATAVAALSAAAASGSNVSDLAPAGAVQAVRVSSSSSSSSSSSFLSGLMPQVSSLIGEDAAAMFLAAAAAAASSPAGPRPGCMPSYTSLTHCMPASIKVHTSHSNYTALAPVLTSSLATGLASLNSAMFPLYVESACFAGCVQLLANIFTVKSIEKKDESKSGCTSHREPGNMAMALFAAVSDSLHAVGLLGRQESLFAEPVHINRQDFAATYGNALAAGDAASAKDTGRSDPSGCDNSPAWNITSGPDSKARLADTQPGIGISVGMSAVGSCKPTVAGEKPTCSVITASNSMCCTSVILQCPQPACLVAG